VPAVPSTSGVADVFAFQADGTVQAITSDGTVAWTADLSQARYALPDFQGGLAVVGQLLAGQSSIYKLDGTTGQPYPAYTASGTASLGAYGGSLVAVHPDGTIFAVQQNSDPATYSEWDSVIGIDPTTGAQKFSVDLHSWPGFVWDIMIAGDGYAYVVSSSRDFSANTSQLYLLRVNSSGAYDDFGQIAEWPGAGGDILDPNVGMITNADQGILLTWSAGWGGMALTAGTGVSLVNPPAGPGGGVVPILQAQDGSFVGSYYNDMIAFDASGTARWIVPNETPQIATADGGVIAQSGITYDQNGNATGKMGSLATYSWLGYAYESDPAQVRMNMPDFGLSFQATAGGSLSPNGADVKYVPSKWFIPAGIYDPNTYPNAAALDAGFYANVKADFSPPTKIAVNLLVQGKATVTAFQDALATTNTVVAFLDHGLIPPDQTGAIGLCFSGNPSAIPCLEPGPLAQPFGNINQVVLPNGFTPKARVVFLGGCGIDAKFIAQWHLQKGQALIVPVYLKPSEEMHINLVKVASEWWTMLFNLANGSTVSDAVSAGRTAAKANRAAHSWTFIGDGSVNFNAKTQ
jgi:hypothetical protein